MQDRSSSPGRRRFVGLALVATIALGATAAATPAPAQEIEDGAIGVTLVEQGAWTALGGEVPLRLHVDGRRPGLELRVALHGRLSSRSAFEQTAAGSGLGSVLGRVTLPLDEVPTHRSSGDVLARLALQQPGRGRERTQLPATRAGVYPMTVEVADTGGAVLDGFTTWLVAVGEDPIDAPLAVAWVWPLVAPPYALPDGSPDPGVVEELVPGGRLHGAATTLADAGVPLTLAIGPETLESWRDAASADDRLKEGYEVLRAVARDPSNQLLPVPYVTLDLPALESAGLGEELVPQLLAGADALERIVGRRIDPRTTYVESVDAAALTRLRGAFVDRVAVRNEALVPVEHRLTASRPFTLRTDTLSMRAAATSPSLRALLEGPESRGLRAQRFLAGLSLVALEAPSLDRGVVFSEHTDWTADRALLGMVLDGLAGHPLLDAVTLDDYFDRVPDDTIEGGDGQLVRSLVPLLVPPYPVSRESFDHARSTLASFADVVGDDDPGVRRGERSLLVGLSSALPATRANEHLGVVDEVASGFLSGITTADKTVTLTARSADIPLSFGNSTGRPVTVRIHLASSKLLFPEGDEQTVELAEGNTTVRFPVRARVSGTFTMTVTVTSEDGRLAIGEPTSVTIRSAVFSGAGTFLMIGAAAFLAVWWGTHAFRRRRARRATASPGPA